MAQSPLGIHMAMEAGNGGLARVVQETAGGISFQCSGLSHGCLGWHLAIAQLQRPELSARMVLGLQQGSGGRERGGLR